ncbi:hypothetical protein R3Q06_35885, partial [Rhodococcus erythropolis]|uniref:hypothetical protein n=1 Tax=Rhodococcus erythropolis TaxID=1833 RepID=UPI0029494226
LDLVAKWPLPNGGHESRPRNDSNFLPPFGSNSYWIGHLCYNHLWWNLDRMWSLLDHDGAFRLRGEYSGLQVTWNPYYDDVPNEAFLKPNRADGTC